MTSRKDKAHNFIDSFKALSLVGKKRPSLTPPAPAPAPSAGGFASSPHLPMPFPLPNDGPWVPPPPMLYPNNAAPQPASRTMQHALAGFFPPGADVPTTPPRMPVPEPFSRPSPPSPPPKPSRQDQPTTPQPPKLQPPKIYRRAKSEPLSPVASNDAAPVGGTRQCNGVTTAGKRCRNQVRVSDAQALAGGDVFCRVHGNKVGEVSGFYDRKTGQTFVKFEDWIPSYLQTATQNALRVEMQKARAPSDVEGYIYTFEILDPADKKTIHLKVGRATNLNKRMDQWGKQCGSKEQILRGFWPGGMDKGGVPMKGLVHAGPKGPWCHRVERLVHIELSDLVEYTPYLEDGYPNVGVSKEVKKGGKKDVKRCPDCNTKHQEIFSFERVTEGRYEGKEWEEIVKPVIEKWGGFVEGYL